MSTERPATSSAALARPSPGVLAVLLAAALSAGFAHLGVAVLRRSERLRELDILSIALAASVLLCAAALLVTWLILAVPRRAWRWPALPLAVAIGLAAVVVAILWPTWEMIVAQLPELAPAEFLLLIAVVWSSVVWLPLSGYAVVRYGSIGEHLGALLLLTPGLAAACLGLVWLEVWWAVGLSSLRSLASVALWAVSVVLLFVAALRAARRWPLAPMLGAFLGVVVLVGGLALLNAPTSGPPPPAVATRGDQPQVILLITVDTLRADLIPPLGRRAAALEPLIDDSVVFLAARSASPWTKPAAASILTGLSPAVHGAISVPSQLPDSVETLAEHLHAAGYWTAAIGRNTFLRETFNFQQGFTEYAFFPRGDGGVLATRLLRALWPRRFASDPSTRDLTDMAIDWLRARHGRKMFLWLHYFDPHGPYAPPPAHMPANGRATRIGGSFAAMQAIRAGDLVPDLAERQWIRQLYEAEADHVGEEIGRLLQAVREMGIYDDALVAFTSDHGEEFWEHGGFEHGHAVYDEVLHVPLAFKLPRATSRQRFAPAVSTASVTPTLLELAGLDLPAERFTAESLVSWWRNAPPTTAAPVFSMGVHYYEPKEAVIFRELKLIRELLSERSELYDLAADPGELRSLAAQAPALVDEAQQLFDLERSRSEELRRRLGIADTTSDLDRETLDDLRSLGYVH